MRHPQPRLSRCGDGDGADRDAPCPRRSVARDRTHNRATRPVNAVTGWILSIGLVAAVAGLILAVSGAVYAAGAVCLVVAALLVVPLRIWYRRSPERLRTPQSEATRGGRTDARTLGASREVVIVLAATFLMIGAFDVLTVMLRLAHSGSGAPVPSADSHARCRRGRRGARVVRARRPCATRYRC